LEQEADLDMVVAEGKDTWTIKALKEVMGISTADTGIVVGTGTDASVGEMNQFWTDTIIMKSSRKLATMVEPKFTNCEKKEMNIMTSLLRLLKPTL
jgi:hypothetical protein